MERELTEFEVVEMCVTSRCNLKCTHCYQANEKNKYQLSFNKIVEVVNFAQRYKCQNFVLSGGEFFTHPNSYEILEYIAKNTNAKITCVTNATILDVNKINRIVDKDRLSFKISIDGDEREHDLRRGEGKYALTVEKIKALKELGYTAEITMTLIEENIHCIPSVFSNPVFEKVTLMPVATTGAACDYFSREKDTEIYEKVICHIYKTCRDYVDGTHRCYIFPRCFSVKYDGKIYPCSLSRDYDLCCLGDLNEGSVEQIINNFLVSKESDMFFEYDNNNQIDKCNGCQQNSECTRGCRIRAYKWNGKLTSHDPFACKIFRGEYKDIPFGQIYWGTRKNN